MGPETLAQVLCHLPKVNDPNLLVGTDTSDDAAVYKVTDDIAIIQTLDFFTPIVDDPYIFGQIAAANSLSDIYAMGGKPVFALNIVCFPSCLPVEILGKIIEGGTDKVREAGAIIVGGHTIDDNEPKYGLSVTGFVHPQKVLTNSSAKAGDIILLTKPVGTGILNTAIKGEAASDKNISDAVNTMLYLNKYAAEVAAKYEISACTDITGFGVLGHVYEMSKGSSLSIILHYKDIPVLDGVQEFAKMGIIPQGAYRNRKYMEGKYTFDSSIKEYMLDILFDPQTSGGLLYALNPSQAEKMAEEMLSLKIPCSIIGEVVEKQKYHIYID